MLILKIALRNIFRNKRRTILTVLTMGSGFIFSALAIGMIDGSYSYIINMFTRNRLGHIQIHKKGYLDKPSLYDTVNNYDNIGKEIIGIEGIQTWAPRLYSAGLVSVGEKSAGVRIIGIDPVREELATRFEKKIIAGKKFPAQPSHRVILGKGLARILNAQPTGRIVVVSQAADGSIANDVYEISGIVDTGDELSDRVAFYMPLKDAQDFLALDNRVHELIVLVNNIHRVRKITTKIEQKLNQPELAVNPWQEFAKPFYQAMKADERGHWIMLFVIMLIVAVGVLNTVLMSVLERRREYGLLKAVGTKPRQIFDLVLSEVNILALLSIFIGGVAGILLNYLLSFRGISLPQEFTFGGVVFSKIYSEVSARSLYIPSITVMISAILVSILPALNASRVDPAKAMRTE